MLLLNRCIFDQSISPGSRIPMTISLTPLFSLIAGILILMMPKLLNYIVAFYLIIIGLVGLLGIGPFSLSA
jgi:hypothetical protein